MRSHCICGIKEGPEGGTRRSPDEGTQDQVRAQATMVTSGTSSAAGCGVLLGAPLGDHRVLSTSKHLLYKGPTWQGHPGLQQAPSLLVRLAVAAPGTRPLRIPPDARLSHLLSSFKPFFRDES